MNRLYKEDELALNETGLKINEEFINLIEQFYNKHRNNNISIIDLKSIMYNGIEFLPITELLRNE